MIAFLLAGIVLYIIGSAMEHAERSAREDKKYGPDKYGPQ